MVVFSDFSSLLAFVQAQGYWIIFVLILALGPVAVLAAAFAASFGIFNVFLVFILAFLGSSLGDLFWYSIGEFGRISFIDKHFQRLMKNKTLRRVEKLLNKNSFRAILLIKLVPPLPVPGLIFAGMDKLRLRKFLFASLVINFVSSIVFVVLGYYFGVVVGKLLFSPLEISLGFLTIFSLMFVYHRRYSFRFYRKR